MLLQTWILSVVNKVLHFALAKNLNSKRAEHSLSCFAILLLLLLLLCCSCCQPTFSHSQRVLFSTFLTLLVSAIILGYYYRYISACTFYLAIFHISVCCCQLHTLAAAGAGAAAASSSSAGAVVLAFTYIYKWNRIFQRIYTKCVQNAVAHNWTELKTNDRTQEPTSQFSCLLSPSLSLILQVAVLSVLKRSWLQCCQIKKKIFIIIIKPLRTISVSSFQKVLEIFLS